MQTFFLELSKKDPDFLAFLLSVPEIENDFGTIDRLWSEYHSEEMQEESKSILNGEEELDIQVDEALSDKVQKKNNQVLLIEKYLMSSSIAVLAVAVWIAKRDPSPFYLSYLMTHISHAVEPIKTLVSEAILVHNQKALGVISEAVVGLTGPSQTDALIILKALLQKYPQYQNIAMLTDVIQDKELSISTRLSALEVLSVVETEKALAFLFSALQEHSWELSKCAYEGLIGRSDVLSGVIWEKIKASRLVQEKVWLLRLLTTKSFNNKVQVELMDAFKNEENILIKKELLETLSQCQEMSVSHFFYHAWEKEENQETKEDLYHILVQRASSLASLLQSQIKEKKKIEEKMQLIRIMKNLDQFDHGALKLIETLVVDSPSSIEYRVLLLEVASHLIGRLPLEERSRYKETQAFFLKEVFFISKQVDNVEIVTQLSLLLKYFIEPVKKEVIGQFISEKLLMFEYMKEEKESVLTVANSLDSLVEYLEKSKTLLKVQPSKACLNVIYRLCLRYKEEERMRDIALRLIEAIKGFLSFLEGEVMSKSKKKKLFSPQEKEELRFALSILVQVKSLSAQFRSYLKQILTDEEGSMLIKEEFVPLITGGLKKDYWNIVEEMVNHKSAQVKKFGKDILKQRLERVGITLKWPENKNINFEKIKLT